MPHTWLMASPAAWATPSTYSGLRVLLGGEFVDRPALAVYPTTAQRIEGAVGVMLVVVLDQPAQAAVGEPWPCRRWMGARLP